MPGLSSICENSAKWMSLSCCAMCRLRPSLLTLSAMATYMVSPSCNIPLENSSPAAVRCLKATFPYHTLIVLCDTQSCCLWCSGREASGAFAYGFHHALDANRNISSPNGDVLFLPFTSHAVFLYVCPSARLIALSIWCPQQDADQLLWCCQARMLYTYKLPNGVLRLSDKAEYFADASDAYHSLAKVQHLSCSFRTSCSGAFPVHCRLLSHLICFL